MSTAHDRPRAQPRGGNAGVRVIETDKACPVSKGPRRWVDDDPRDDVSLAFGLVGYIGAIALAAGTLSLVTAVMA